MNKLEVGMYARTNEGIKEIIDYEYDDEIENGHRIHFKGDRYGIMYTEEELPKCSWNIKKLIEEGDFVEVRIDGIFINCFMVDKFEDEDGNIELGIGCYEDGLLNTISEYRPLNTLEILGIVTKEQFKSMEYRLGE